MHHIGSSPQRVCALSFSVLCILCVLCAVAAPRPAEATVSVSTVGGLVAAVDDANAGGDADIALQPGTYTLSNMLQIHAANVTVRSAGGDRSSVVIRGQGMQGGVAHCFLVWADNFTVRDLTLADVANHAVQLQVGVDGLRVSNCIIRDTYEQMIKGPYDATQPTVTCDNGIVENCYFYYSAGVGPQWYIGGVDVHNGHNWIIRDNTFRDIQSPDTTVAEHAVHFWSDSSGTLVERNLIINCDRGIGFGLGDRGHSGGIIRNNMIYHDASGTASDVGIALENSPNTQVYNNTVYQEHSYKNAIEYRFAGTSNVLIVNNLTNKAIASRDGGSGTVGDNVTSAQAAWFVHPSGGDLHLAGAVAGVVGAGRAVTGLTEDYDGHDRPAEAPDIGADQHVPAIPALGPVGVAVLLLLLANAANRLGSQAR